MSRLSFEKYEGDTVTWKKEDAGNGATGQIKKAGWFGRKIEISVKSQIGVKNKTSIHFNRGSLVDWLKSRGHTIDKGNWCCGGDDDDTIIGLFNAEMKKLKTPKEPIDPELAALEKAAKSGENSDVVAFVTECLKNKPRDYRYSLAQSQWESAIARKDHQTALDIKNLFFENGYKIEAFNFTLVLAHGLNRSDLYIEVANMYRNGTGTEVNEKEAEFYTNKAIEIKQNKEALEIEIRELETKVSNGEVEWTHYLVQDYLKSNPPYYEKAKKQFEDAQKAMDDTRMYKIAEAFSHFGYSSEAERLYLEIVNSTKQAKILELETHINNGNATQRQLVAEYLADQVRTNKDYKLLGEIKEVFRKAGCEAEEFNITLEMADHLKTAELYREVSSMFKYGFGTEADQVKAKYYDDLASAARKK